MPSFDIVKKTIPQDTYRVKSVIGAFDLDNAKLDEHFTGNIDIEGKDWNIGLIVGGSGTGKTTIAREIFGDNIYAGMPYTDAAVVDDMPKGCTMQEIERMFTSVGFASPPNFTDDALHLTAADNIFVYLCRRGRKGEIEITKKNQRYNMPNPENLKPCKKGETHNPNGRPKKLANTIVAFPRDAQEKIYAVLYQAIATKDKTEATAILQKGAQELPEYGLIYQLATKELLGKNGWDALNDILDRLFGKAKIVTDNTINTGESGLIIGFKKADD